MAAGRDRQEAFRADVTIYNEHKNIQANVLQKTGFEWTKVLQFPFSGGYKDDVRRADQSRLGFASDIARITRDLLRMKGANPDPADPVDKKAFALLAGVVFPWRAILDSAELAQPAKGSPFFAECAKAPPPAKALHGENALFQAQLEKGATIVKLRQLSGSTWARPPRWTNDSPTPS